MNVVELEKLQAKWGDDLNRRFDVAKRLDYYHNNQTHYLKKAIKKAYPKTAEEMLDKYEYTYPLTKRILDDISILFQTPLKLTIDNENLEKKFNEMPELNHGWAEYAPLYDDMIKEASKNQVLRSIGWMTRIKPLFLSSGRIILPLYSDGYNLSICAISDDDGESWKPSKPIVGRGPIQPALAVRKNGDIVAYMRDSGDAPARVHKSISKDNGESWSYTVKTDILNEASVELLVLNDGRWAFFGNDLNDGRYRLVLMLSDDEGETWKWKEYIENDNKQGGGSYSYPSLIQTEDGLLHITYSSRTSETEKSIKHIVVNTDKIR